MKAGEVGDVKSKGVTRALGVGLQPKLRVTNVGTFNMLCLPDSKGRVI